MVAASSAFERCSGIWSKSRHATAMSVQGRAIHCSTIFNPTVIIMSKLGSILVSIRASLDVNILMRNVTPIKRSKKHQDVPSSPFRERITRPEKKGNKKTREQSNHPDENIYN